MVLNSSTQKLAETLGLQPQEYSISFQSRLGRQPWVQPYTDHVLPRLREARSVGWFRERGFELKGPEALPVERQTLYNWQRNSRVLVKRLAR